MAKYLKHDEHLHVLTLTKAEAVNIIQMLVAQLGNTNGACPDVVIQDWTATRLAFVIEPELVETDNGK